MRKSGNAASQSQTIAVTVDGKAAKQMKGENGDSVFILNVFAQTLKLHLAGWSVHKRK